MIALGVGSEHLSAEQARLGELLSTLENPRPLMVVLGREAANTLRRHYREKDRTDANTRSSRRSHIWLEVMRSVQNPVVDSGGSRATVSITHPIIEHKVEGGTIQAKRVANLSIPLSEEAYGRSPSVFESETGKDLVFIHISRRRGALVEQLEGREDVKFHYVLQPEVDQDPDPTALPAQRDLDLALLKRGERWVERQIEKDAL